MRRERGSVTTGGFHSLNRERCRRGDHGERSLISTRRRSPHGSRSRRIRISRRGDVGVVDALDYASGNSDRTSVTLEHLIELMPHRPRARTHSQHERDEDRATPWPPEAARTPRPYAPQQGVARGAILSILSVECPGTTAPNHERHERERPPPRPNRRDRADTAPDTVK